MFYVTGDVHGDQQVWRDNLDKYLMMKDDASLIVLGDFGIGFYDTLMCNEEMFFDELEKKPYSILFCDGNHENFDKLSRYEVVDYCGGKAHKIRKNLIHLMRGEVYDLMGKKTLVFGGGCSIDKEYRVPGKTWWAQEMPSDEEYENARINLRKHGYHVDCILTHTAPADTVELMSTMSYGIDGSFKGELPLTSFLGWVEEAVAYNKWFFGHFHIDNELWKNQHVVFNGIRELNTGNLVKMRYER